MASSKKGAKAPNNPNGAAPRAGKKKTAASGPPPAPTLKARRLVRTAEHALVALSNGKLPGPLANPDPSPDTRFKAGNPWRWQPGNSGNPRGSPSAVKRAYADYLAYADEDGVTNAAKVAIMVGTRAIEMWDLAAAIELRRTTEGDTINLSTLTDAELDARLAAERVEIERLERIARGQAEGDVVPGQDVPDAGI